MKRKVESAAGPDPAIDHGTRGPAMLPRPFKINETIRAGVTVREYLDAHLVDRMYHAAQLSDDQYEVAKRVVELHEAAGFEPSVTPGYAPPGWHRGHDDDEPEAKAITKFRELLGSCSVAAAWVLHDMCLGRHPGVRFLEVLQTTLDDLAKGWGISA
jgi:hypothetical protein